jgi:hypothetical protein
VLQVELPDAPVSPLPVVKQIENDDGRFQRDIAPCKDGELVCPEVRPKIKVVRDPESAKPVYLWQSGRLMTHINTMGRPRYIWPELWRVMSYRETKRIIEERKQESESFAGQGTDNLAVVAFCIDCIDKQRRSPIVPAVLGIVPKSGDD